MSHSIYHKFDIWVEIPLGAFLLTMGFFKKQQPTLMPFGGGSLTQFHQLLKVISSATPLSVLNSVTYSGHSIIHLQPLPD